MGYMGNFNCCDKEYATVLTMEPVSNRDWQEFASSWIKTSKDGPTKPRTPVPLTLGMDSYHSQYQPQSLWYCLHSPREHCLQQDYLPTSHLLNWNWDFQHQPGVVPYSHWLRPISRHIPRTIRSTSPMPGLSRGIESLCKLTRLFRGCRGQCIGYTWRHRVKCWSK